MQRLSDGFVAFFGASVAYEDHARRAVLAALELQQRAREELTLRAPLRGASLAISMGFHTGVVIVGPLGEDTQTLYAALDDTPLTWPAASSVWPASTLF
jgi:class 3 adenylate cyclase